MHKETIFFEDLRVPTFPEHFVEPKFGVENLKLYQQQQKGERWKFQETFIHLSSHGR